MRRLRKAELLDVDPNRKVDENVASFFGGDYTGPCPAPTRTRWLRYWRCQCGATFRDLRYYRWHWKAVHIDQARYWQQRALTFEQLISDESETDD